MRARRLGAETVKLDRTKRLLLRTRSLLPEPGGDILVVRHAGAPPRCEGRRGEVEKDARRGRVHYNPQVVVADRDDPSGVSVLGDRNSPLFFWDGARSTRTSTSLRQQDTSLSPSPLLQNLLACDHVLVLISGNHGFRRTCATWLATGG